jgi:hypothetical protein
MMPRISIWVFFWFALAMRTPLRLLTVCNFWIENCLAPIRITFGLDWIIIMIGIILSRVFIVFITLVLIK